MHSRPLTPNSRSHLRAHRLIALAFWWGAGLWGAGLWAAVPGLSAAPADAARWRAACDATAASEPLGPLPGATWTSLSAQAAWLDERTLRVGAGVNRGAVQRWQLAHGSALPAALTLGRPLPDGVARWDLDVLGETEAAAWRATPSGRMTSQHGAGPVLRWAGMTAGAVGIGTPTSSAGAPVGDAGALRALHQGPSALIGLDVQGHVVVAERLQAALALDALYGAAQAAEDLGVQVGPGGTRWAVWAPTARAVWVCVHAPRGGPVTEVRPAELEAHTGIWRATVPRKLSGQTYRYLVDVFVPSQGWVRNRVTDPYAISLTADSQHAYIGSLDDPRLMPPGWRERRRPDAPRAKVDMMISELHVRDFSAGDQTVPAAHRGKYLAFTHPRSRGMRHLAEMARAGLTDVHLLPVFDLATVPERGCVSPDAPRLRGSAPDSTEQQALVQAVADRDCFNWGYDPWHFNAPEGSFATDAHDPAVRILEWRRMVMALQGLGLRVGMDVVYNHMSASGQSPRSVLDRLVPGYYHRLDARGAVEQSTCCDNTATEHRMMRKLMIDSAVLWVRHHGVDSFRFDLMGHQPREAMEALQRAVDAAAGRTIPLIGEGWNFGEIADGARFVQASQLSLGGSGIATFNDRLRDAARGTRHGDGPEALVERRGWLNGARGAALAEAADLIRAGLAGSVRDLRLTLHDGRQVNLHDLDYGGQPAGYVTDPGEVVNYVENHDNPTLFDLNAFKLPLNTPARERAEIQVLGSALVALSQGVAYWHAGQEILRSKSLDLNSYDSGDWFNRLDWTLRDNGFGAGLPPGRDSQPFWPVMAPRLVHPGIKPRPEDIRFSRQAHLDLLRLRASTPLLRLPSATAIRERVSFPGSGPQGDPSLIAMRIEGRGWSGSPHRAVMVLFNSGSDSGTLRVEDEAETAWVLHPVHRETQAGDRRIRAQARWEVQARRFTVPPRSAVVFVAE